MPTGQYVLQPDGTRPFIPASLPPQPPLDLDKDLILSLSEADSELGRLDGVASVLPNPDLFVAMYVRQEAVLSSQIEGTQSTLEDVLQFEIDPGGKEHPKDVAEVVNYIQALNFGLKRVQKLPLSLRLIREIHDKLLQGVRGGNRTPGEFRTKQNWIGPENTPITNASFVPPPVEEMHKALGNFEEFLHDTKSYPPLIHCALVHAQFETIHPFLDGNGRIGRLLITFLLCQRGVLGRPLLYLSHFLKAHRAEYYDRLMAIRNDGNWNQWLKFFLQGVHGVSRIATSTARKILALGKEDRALIEQEMRGHTDSIKALDYLFETPILTVRLLELYLKCSYVKANNLVAAFGRLGILEETSGGDRRRNRRFRYKRYLKIFDVSESAPAEAEERRTVETTVAE